MRLTPLLTAAVLVAAPVAITALPASAAACTAATTTIRVAPRTVVVDDAGTKGFDIEVAVKHHGCAIGAVQAVITSPKASLKLPLSAQAGNATTTYYYGGLDLTADALDDAEAGTWTVRSTSVWAAKPAGLTRKGAKVARSSTKVSVLADADLTADATSSALTQGQISKGKALTVKGTLTRARWEAGKSTGYAKQRVQVQFRTPKGSYKLLKTVTTKAGGTFSTAVKATKDGCYRVRFAGSKSVAPVASAGKCIDVR
jgi:hypothetical protein